MMYTCSAIIVEARSYRYLFWESFSQLLPCCSPLTRPVLPFARLAAAKDEMDAGIAAAKEEAVEGLAIAQENLSAHIERNRQVGPLTHKHTLGPAGGSAYTQTHTWPGLARISLQSSVTTG